MPVSYQVGFPAWPVTGTNDFIILGVSLSVIFFLLPCPSICKAIKRVCQNNFNIGKLLIPKSKQHFGSKCVITNRATYAKESDTAIGYKPANFVCRSFFNFRYIVPWQLSVAGKTAGSIPQFGCIHVLYPHFLFYFFMSCKSLLQNNVKILILSRHIGGEPLKIYDFDGMRNISGDRIHQARTAKRLSQAELAARMQVNGVTIEREAISKIETGDRFVTDYELKIFSKVLNVSMEWLTAQNPDE